MKWVVLGLLFTATHMGCEEEFAERDFPRLLTSPVKNISGTGAEFSAEIILPGNFEILEYGFVWAEHSNPDIDRGDTVILADNLKDSKFSATLNANLRFRPPTYHVRAFVRTADFLVYGNNFSFVR